MPNPRHFDFNGGRPRSYIDLIRAGGSSNPEKSLFSDAKRVAWSLGRGQFIAPQAAPACLKQKGRPGAVLIQTFSRTSKGCRPERPVARLSSRLLASAFRTSLRSSRISATRWARDRRSVLEDRLVASNLGSIVSSNAEIRLGLTCPLQMRAARPPNGFVSSPANRKFYKDTTRGGRQPLIVLSPGLIWTQRKVVNLFRGIGRRRNKQNFFG